MIHPSPMSHLRLAALALPLLACATTPPPKPIPVSTAKTLGIVFDDPSCSPGPSPTTADADLQPWETPHACFPAQVDDDSTCEWICVVRAGGYCGNGGTHDDAVFLDESDGDFERLGRVTVTVSSMDIGTVFRVDATQHPPAVIVDKVRAGETLDDVPLEFRMTERLFIVDGEMMVEMQGKLLPHSKE